MPHSHIISFLSTLNTTYRTLHTTYEEYFWISYMGDHSQDEQMNQAMQAMDEFRSSTTYAQQVQEYISELASQAGDAVDIEQLKSRLEGRAYFFSLYQIPQEMKTLKQEIDSYETDLQQRRATYEAETSGYIDPDSGAFVQMTGAKMSLEMRTNDDENIRRACFEGGETSALAFVDDLIRLVNKRNEFARGCGYTDFYEYKAKTEERMGSQEIFDLFDSLYEPLAENFQRVRELEREDEQKPGLREPWNLGYMLTGDFTKQEDPYFPLSEMVECRGKSMTALGVTYAGATLRLDLLERDGKYNNGFCHQPVVGGDLDSAGHHSGGETNFTCNAIPGQVGSGDTAGMTLFHEGGHAAHFANMRHSEVIFNTERAPCSTAWAETQSMFLDTMYSSIERKTIYAKTVDGEGYPFALYEKMVHDLAPLAGRGMLAMANVVKLEQILYSTPEDTLTVDFVTDLARELSVTYRDYATPMVGLLTLPHIYARASSAYYHAYAMATLALYQFRAYIYDRDGYIVDNPALGAFLQQGWTPGSSTSMTQLMQEMIGTSLDPQAYLDVVTLNPAAKIAQSLERIATTRKLRTPVESVSIDAVIELRDGKEQIGSSEVDGWDGMCEKWRKRVGG